MTGEELIQPGDPRHPCDICGRRSSALHCTPCAPVPLSEAYQGSYAAAGWDEADWSIYSIDEEAFKKGFFDMLNTSDSACHATQEEFAKALIARLRKDGIQDEFWPRNAYIDRELDREREAENDQ
jgi:hypothetical protein